MTDERKLDQAARAAWLSYVAGRKQDEIAQEMGVSRQTAQRLVAQAMAAGLVKVRIDHPLSGCFELEKALQQKFALKKVVVTPGEAGKAGVAIAVAEFIELQLQQSEPITLAIGTGRTLSAGVAQMSRRDCPQHRIVSLTGNISPDGSTAFYNVLFSLSDVVTARTFPLMVPVISTTKEERDALHRQPGNTRVIEMARNADTALIGLGSMGPEAPLAQDGFMTPAEVRALRDQGAAGEMLGRSYDIDGNFLPMDGRVASCQLPDPDRALVIAAAGGPEKVDPIRGALRSGVINGLITDETTAKSLLA